MCVRYKRCEGLYFGCFDELDEKKKKEEKQKRRKEKEASIHNHTSCVVIINELWQ